ncbi:unnamed protein product [Urochloa humidicola]
MASSTTAAAAVDAGACPWGSLPSHLQERILALIPVTELLPVAAASRALRHLLRSPAFHALLSQHRLDAFFLLTPRLAVHPLSRRVLPTPPLAALCPPSYPLVSSASPSRLITYATLHSLPPIPDGSYLLSVVVQPPPSSSCILVAVTTGVAVRSYTWTPLTPPGIGHLEAISRCLSRSWETPQSLATGVRSSSSAVGPMLCWCSISRRGRGRCYRL